LFTEKKLNHFIPVGNRIKDASGDKQLFILLYWGIIACNRQQIFSKGLEEAYEWKQKD